MTWKTTPIGTVIRTSQYGLSLLADPAGGIPIVGMKDIQDGRVRIDPEVRVTLTDEDAEPYLLKDGDILLNRTNSPDLVGKAGIYRGDGKAVFASYLVRLELDQTQVDPDFIIQILASEGGQRRIRQLATRAVSQANLNPTTFKNHFLIPIPALKEQVGIRDVLMAWDTAIETTERLIAAKKRYYTHELSRLISRGQHPRTHVGAVVREVSERNRCGHLLRLGDLLTESREPDTEQNPAKRLTVRLHLQGVEARPARGTESDGATTFYRRRAGQLIYGKQNIFRGAIGIIPHELDGYCSTQDLPAFDVDATVNAEWLYYWLSRENFYKSLESLASGSGSKRLHPEEFFNIKIELPDLSTQTAIARYLNALREEIGLLDKSLDALKRQKRGLMQKLLTGEWLVPVTEVEVT